MPSARLIVALFTLLGSCALTSARGASISYTFTSVTLSDFGGIPAGTTEAFAYQSPSFITSDLYLTLPQLSSWTCAVCSAIYYAGLYPVAFRPDYVDVNGSHDTVGFTPSVAGAPIWAYRELGGIPDALGFQAGREPAVSFVDALENR